MKEKEKKGEASYDNAADKSVEEAEAKDIGKGSELEDKDSEAAAACAEDPELDQASEAAGEGFGSSDSDLPEEFSEKAAKMAAESAAVFEEAAGSENEESDKETLASAEDKLKDKKISELEDRVKRNIAEFDNFRKRSEKEKAAMFDMGAKSVAEKILPTIDNFERALKSIPEDKECEAFAEGMDMIYRQFLKNLEEVGVKEIDALGEKFNPNFHNAVMHVEDEEADENTVVEVFQKGYMYKESVLRFCMVKVAN